MDFHRVETRFPRIQRASAISLNNAGEFGKFKCARRWIGGHRLPLKHKLPVCSDGAGRDRQSSVEEKGMRDAPDMPKLQQHSAACLVYGAGDCLPAFHLLRGPDAWRIRISHTHWRNRGSLRENEASRGALRVILRHQCIRNTSFARSAARERGHQNAIG